MKERKTDRRTIYTQNAVKDALLGLLAERPFEKITVASICRHAEITRTTFYLHFTDITDVIDELLEDALHLAEHESEDVIADMVFLLERTSQTKSLDYSIYDTFLPAYQRIADHPKYKPLFLDETLSAYIIKKLYIEKKDQMIPILINRCGLTHKQADKVFLFMVYGSFYVNKSMNWEKGEEWYQLQSILTKFILNGLQSLS